MLHVYKISHPTGDTLRHGILPVVATGPSLLIAPSPQDYTLHHPPAGYYLNASVSSYDAPGGRVCRKQMDTPL